jgi:selenide,water dikinase
LRPLAGLFDATNLAQSEVARNLLVGLGAPDDAAVYRVAEDRALIQTIDFFPPVVDDAYAFGAIAAANAMSDIYAMGGEVLFGLNIAAWRDDLPLELLSEIFRGGAEKMREGGGLIAGGHTINDKEPKYGIAVTGMVNPRDIFTKGGAQVGDTLILTKPLGTGILTTAGKRGIVAEPVLERAIEWMMRLNRAAAQAARKIGIHAATDITGFALLGHAYEMASASNAQFVLERQNIPIMEGAFEMARQGSVPGGTTNNRDYLRDKVLLPQDLSDEWDAVLFDPQTSGGLLIAVAPGKTDALTAEFARLGVAHWTIGTVAAGQGVRIL